MMKYKLGQILYSTLYNQHGTIIHILPDYGEKTVVYGMEFISNIRGHNCNGHGKDGYCWYHKKNEIIQKKMCCSKPVIKTKQTFRTPIMYCANCGKITKVKK